MSAPPTDKSPVVFYYAPRTRSFTALWLLEELGIEYTLESFDLSTDRHKKDDFIAFNPMGKVPVVVEGSTPVSELGAIAIYLSDKFTDAGLAPALDDSTRPAYLRWIFFSSAIMEPAFGEKFFQWDVPASSVAWGSFAHMMAMLNAGLTGRRYLLGEEFSAADVLVGSSIRFGHMFGAIPAEGVTKTYVDKLEARDAFKRATAIEERESERFPAK